MRYALCICAATVIFVLGWESNAWLGPMGQPPLYVGDWKWCLAPHSSPILELPDDSTVVIHRPPKKWFTISCIEWTDTYMRPAYGSKGCNLEGVRPPDMRNAPGLVEAK